MAKLTSERICKDNAKITWWMKLGYSMYILRNMVYLKSLFMTLKLIFFLIFLYDSNNNKGTDFFNLTLFQNHLRY